MKKAIIAVLLCMVIVLGFVICKSCSNNKDNIDNNYETNSGWEPWQQ